MKKIVLLLLLALPLFAVAQRQIEVKENKVATLIFPDEIDYYRGGFLPDDFVIENVKNVLYITPVYPGVKNTNLTIATKKGMYFNLDISYNDRQEKFDYIILKSDAFHIDGETDKVNSSKITQISPKEEQITDNTTDTLQAIANKILAKSGYITVNNTVRYKNLFFILKGIYIYDNTIFIRLNAMNKSAVKFDFDYIAFYVGIQKSKNKTSVENLQMFPVKKFNYENTLSGGENRDMLFAFDKFTIGVDKVLNCDLLEKNGERNLTLQVNDKILLDAQKVEL